MTESLTEDPMLARLDRIERRLDRLVSVLDEALPTIGMAADSADEWVAGLQRRGVDVDARTQAALNLVERASTPETLERLGSLLERLEALEPALALVENADHSIGMAADAFDAWATEQAGRGIDLDARAQGLGSLLEKLSTPANVAILERTLEQLPRIEAVIQLSATFEDTTGMLFDMFDAQVAELQASGIDAEARFAQVLSLVTRLTDPEFHHHLENLLDAAPNLMAATRTGEVFGRAIDEVANAGEPPRVGVWGLLQALGSPEVQRAAGFAIEVARKVGERLPDHATSTQLTARS